MAEQKQDDQLEHSYSSYVRIRDVALKTCRRRWTKGRSGERVRDIRASGMTCWWWWWLKSSIFVFGTVIKILEFVAPIVRNDPLGWLLFTRLQLPSTYPRRRAVGVDPINRLVMSSPSMDMIKSRPYSTNCYAKYSTSFHFIEAWRRWLRVNRISKNSKDYSY